MPDASSDAAETWVATFEIRLIQARQRPGVPGRPASCSRISPSLAAVATTARTPAHAGRRSFDSTTESSPPRSGASLRHPRMSGNTPAQHGSDETTSPNDDVIESVSGDSRRPALSRLRTRMRVRPNVRITYRGGRGYETIDHCRRLGCGAFGGLVHAIRSPAERCRDSEQRC